MILGVTPARGGSKGVPRKNIRSLAGKPLIAWTVEAALASKRMDRYVVSTEDPEIAEVSRISGAEVIPRPEELATDEATTLAVLQQVLRQIPAETVVLLQATSPIRDPELIDRCIQRFLDSKADSLATGFNCKYQPYGSPPKRRQEIPGFFYDDGNIYVIRGGLIQEGDLYGKRREQVLTDQAQNVEIDEPFDFWLAEQILTQRMQQLSSAEKKTHVL